MGLGCPVLGSPRLDTLLRPLLSCLGECSRTDSGGAARSLRCSGPPGICAGLVPSSVSSPAGEHGASRLRGPQAGCVEFLRRRLPWEMCLGNEILPITVLPRGERASFNYSSPNRRVPSTPGPAPGRGPRSGAVCSPLCCLLLSSPRDPRVRLLGGAEEGELSTRQGAQEQGACGDAGMSSCCWGPGASHELPRAHTSARCGWKTLRAWKTRLAGLELSGGFLS